jgi:hypothetical protein
LPQLGILDRILARRAPTIAFPAVNPFRHTVFDISAVGDNRQDGGAC